MHTVRRLYLFLLLGVVTSVWAAALANDDFAGRQLLSGASVTVTADNTGATVEAAETELSPANYNTLWWSWTAPTNGLLNLHVFSSTNNVKVVAWQGETLTNLNLIASKDFVVPLGPPWVLFPPPTPPEPLRFEVQAGQTYHISIGSSTPGPFSLSLDLCSMRVLIPTLDAVVKGPTNLLVQLSAPQLNIEGQLQALSVTAIFTNPITWTGQRGFYHVPGSTGAPAAVTITNLLPNDYLVYVDATNGAGRRILGPTNHFRVLPGNDFFTNAIPISGFGAPQPFSFVFCTAEVGEPVVAMQYDQRSLWWRWTAPSNGPVLVSAGEAGLGVFSGSRVSQLTALPSIYSDGVLRFQAQRGGVYYIKAVPTFYTWYGSLVITPAPANDDFAHRIHLAGTNFTVTVSNVPSSIEVGEPAHQTPGSLWWTWTAPSTGLLVISPDSPLELNYASVEAFHGTSVLELTPKLNMNELNLIEGIAYRVVAGETLQLAIHADTDRPSANLKFRFYATPPKDQLRIIDLSSQGMAFSLMGEAGQVITLETSTNLLNWIPIQSTTATNTGQMFFGRTPVEGKNAFFRLRRN
jgi:hypothetical protein